MLFLYILVSLLESLCSSCANFCHIESASILPTSVGRQLRLSSFTFIGKILCVLAHIRLPLPPPFMFPSQASGGWPLFLSPAISLLLSTNSSPRAPVLSVDTFFVYFIDLLSPPNLTPTYIAILCSAFAPSSPIYLSQCLVELTTPRRN